MISGLLKQNRLEEFQLEKERNYKIIGDSSLTDEDSVAFEKLIEGLKVIGFRETDMNQIFKIIASIVLLGELKFT
mgnify:FL=1